VPKIFDRPADPCSMNRKDFAPPVSAKLNGHDPETTEQPQRCHRSVKPRINFFNRPSFSVHGKPLYRALWPNSCTPAKITYMMRRETACPRRIRFHLPTSPNRKAVFGCGLVVRNCIKLETKMLVGWTPTAVISQLPCSTILRGGSKAEQPALFKVGKEKPGKCTTKMEE
jgi:hypothetical protein